jgi:glycosyltransferase involved in cell wall biosynthesis
MNSKKVVVSIIVPTRNQQKYIGRCLRSLIAQKFDNQSFEIIVINDCSSDNTRVVLNAFSEDIKILENKKKLGLGASLNKGINSSKGQFIIRVDSDDYVNEDFIGILHKFLIHNKAYNAAACDYYLVDENEKIISREDCIRSPIGCGIMFRQEALLEIGLYDPKLILHEEKELMSRFLKKNKIIRIEVPLYRYRRHESNITNNKIRFNKLLKKLNKKINA